VRRSCCAGQFRLQDVPNVSHVSSVILGVLAFVSGIRTCMPVDDLYQVPANKAVISGC